MNIVAYSNTCTNSLFQMSGLLDLTDAGFGQPGMTHTGAGEQALLGSQSVGIQPLIPPVPLTGQTQQGTSAFTAGQSMSNNSACTTFNKI